MSRRLQSAPRVPSARLLNRICRSAAVQVCLRQIFLDPVGFGVRWIHLDSVDFCVLWSIWRLFWPLLLRAAICYVDRGLTSFDLHRWLRGHHFYKLMILNKFTSAQRLHRALFTRHRGGYRRKMTSAQLRVMM